MQNKNRLVKVGAVGVGASLVVAGAIFAIENSESTQFSGDSLKQNDFEFMAYVSKHGKNYATKSEYKVRQSNWAQ